MASVLEGIQEVFSLDLFLITELGVIVGDKAF